MVPFRAVFEQAPGVGMRERLKAEAGGAILAWIVEGARLWHETGTAPPAAVRDMTAEYLSDQDLIGQWLTERCTRAAGASERSGDLHRNYTAWCEAQGARPKSNVGLSAHLLSAGFAKKATMVGKVFYGLRLNT